MGMGTDMMKLRIGNGIICFTAVEMVVQSWCYVVRSLCVSYMISCCPLNYENFI